jgi:hypothetical protein
VVTSRRTLSAEIGSAIISPLDGVFEHVRGAKSVARRLKGAFSAIKPRSRSLFGFRAQQTGSELGVCSQRLMSVNASI